MVEVADQRDRVLLSPSASSPDLTGASRNFFRIFPSDFVEGTKMGQFAKQKLNLAQVVVLATQSPYGQGIQGVFANEFVRQGGEIVETLEFPAATSDVSGLIERVSTLQPGEMIIWNNFTVLHARTSFRDSAEKKRHLLRLWLDVPGGRPVIPELAERVKTFSGQF